MKKLLLALLLLSAVSTVGHTDDRNFRRIILQKVIITTRSIEAVPEAYISNDVLTVSFDGSGMYSLYIEDNFGVSVYSSALPANGMEYDYDLSGIGDGLFRLVISGPSGEYEGHFTIN